MEQLYSGLIGFILGSICGAFISLIILLFIYFELSNDEITNYNGIENIYDSILTYHSQSPLFFNIGFVLGFLSGIGVFAKKV